MPSGGGQYHCAGADVSLRRRLLAAPVDNVVHVISLATSQLLTVMRGHLKHVSTVRFMGPGDEQLVTASQDGTLGIWAVGTAELQQTIVVGQPVCGLEATAGLLHLAVQWGQRDAGRVRFYDLAAAAMLQSSIKLSSPQRFAASRQGGFVATHDGRRVLLWPAAGIGAGPLVLHHTKSLECIAASDSGERLAAGDATGRILIWIGVAPAVAAAAATAAAGDTKAQLPPPTTVHWHAHAVQALAFSLDSSTLLSGGREGVLVTWRLANNQRSFLAHLGAPLAALLPASDDDAAYVVARSDNSLCQVSSSTGTVVEMASGMLPPPVGSRPPPPPVIQPGGDQTLVVTGQGAVLQLFDMARSTTLARLQVGFQLPPVQNGRQQPSATLEHVAFSADGLVMVTIDSRRDAGLQGGICTFLKFWRADESGSLSFRLATAVESPHGPAGVASLVYHPSRALGASSGSDGGVRFWEPTSDSDGSVCNNWLCRASLPCSDLPVGRLLFSDDGSLLAGATQESVLLWDVAAGVLLASFPLQMHATPTLSHMSFAADSPFLVAAVSEPAGTMRLTAWHLLSLGVAWTAVLSIAALRGVPGGGLAAAFSADMAGRPQAWRSAVVEMDEVSGQPSRCWQAITWPTQLLCSAGKTSSAQGAAHLLVVNSQRAYELAESDLEAGLHNTIAPAFAKAPVTAAGGSNRLWHAFGGLPSESPVAEHGSTPALNGEAARKMLFDLPSHLLQPVQRLAAEFLASLTFS